MNVSEQIDNFIRLNGGNERDALNVALARLDRAEASIAAAVQAEREAYNAIADGYDKRRKELLLHPNRDYHIYADALGEAAAAIRARNSAQGEEQTNVQS